MLYDTCLNEIVLELDGCMCLGGITENSVTTVCRNCRLLDVADITLPHLASSIAVLPNLFQLTTHFC